MRTRGVDAPGNSEHNVSEGEKDSSTSQSQNSIAVESSSSDSARDSSSSEAGKLCSVQRWAQKGRSAAQPLALMFAKYARGCWAN